MFANAWKAARFDSVASDITFQTMSTNFRFAVRILFSIAFAWSALPGLLGADTYQIDPVHSTVEFKVKHLGISTVSGAFREFKGSGVLDPEKPELSTLEVVAQAASVDTGVAKRDEHLRGPDFFDTAKYPTLSFKSTKVEKLTGNKFSVTGDFTLLGVTKPITFEVEASAEAQGIKEEIRRGGETAFTIKRSDYGMAKMIGPIGDEVHVLIAFSAIKQ